MGSWIEICINTIQILPEEPQSEPTRRSFLITSTNVEYVNLRFNFNPNKNCPQGCVYLKSNLKNRIASGNLTWAGISALQKPENRIFTFEYDPALTTKEVIEIHVESVLSFTNKLTPG